MFVVILDNTVMMAIETSHENRYFYYIRATYLNFVAKWREAEALVVERWHEVFPFHHLKEVQSSRGR